MPNCKKHKSQNTESVGGQLKVCLMGAPFDTNNRGVSALSFSLVKLVRDVIPDTRISFFMGNPEKTNKTLPLAGQDVSIKVINYRMSPKAHLQEHLLFLLLLAVLVRMAPSSELKRKIIRINSRLSELDDCNFIGNINGGDSFSDIYGLRLFIENMLPSVITILLGKKLVLFPQTYGPYDSRLARAIAKWVMLRASAVLSRDQDSIALINNLLGSRGNEVPIGFCPDVAFTLPAIMPDQIDIYPPTKFPPADAFIGININGLMFHGGYSGKNMFELNFEYKAFVLKLIERLLNETSSRIFFIPHTYGNKGNVNSDNEAARQIYDALKDRYADRLYMVIGEYNQFEIKGIIGRCDFFIGSRMHACIAAASQAVPTAAVAYSKKFSGLFGGVELSHMVIDARTLSLDEAVNRVLELYHSREEQRVPMKKKIDIAKKQVYKTFEKLLGKKILGKGIE